MMYSKYSTKSDSITLDNYMANDNVDLSFFFNSTFCGSSLESLSIQGK